jgi:hypothetical protein
MSKLIHVEHDKVKDACEKLKRLAKSDEELKQQFKYMETILERVKKERDEKHKNETGGHKK